MKNLIFLLISLILFINCSGSDDAIIDSSPSENSSVLPKKVVFSYPDNFTLNYSYNGNKLDKVMDENGNYSSVTYTGDLITRSDDFNSDNLPTGDYAIYNYSNNKLVQIESYRSNTLDDITNFVYNTDGSVSEIPADSNGNQTNSTWYKNFYDVSGNVIKIEQRWGDEITAVSYYTYDNKNNPFINVIGYNSIRQPQNSRNNAITEKTVTNTGQEYLNNGVYTYNSYGFPTSESSIENPNDLIEYFYYNVTD